MIIGKFNESRVLIPSGGNIFVTGEELITAEAPTRARASDLHREVYVFG